MAATNLDRSLVRHWPSGGLLKQSLESPEDAVPNVRAPRHRDRLLYGIVITFHRIVITRCTGRDHRFHPGRLFVPERHHRLDVNGATGGYPAGQQPDRDDAYGNRERQRISGGCVP